MELCDDMTLFDVRTPEEPEVRLEAVIGGDPGEIGPLRRAVSALAHRSGFVARASDVVLALDEIIANAQEHGRPPVTVRAWSDGRIVVVVRDHGRGFEPSRVWRTHPPDRFGQRGRGLWIVRQLTDCMLIETGATGTTVRIELSPDPHIGA